MSDWLYVYECATHHQRRVFLTQAERDQEVIDEHRQCELETYRQPV